MQRKKISGIYLIQNQNLKTYIGQTNDYANRISHYKTLNCKGQSKLYNSIVKYGFHSHRVVLLFECQTNELDFWEIFFIKLFDSLDKRYGLNLKSGGSYGTHSMETREKLSISQKKLFLNGRVSHNKGKKLSEETKQKLRDANLGKKQSEGTKQKKREIAIKNGNTPPVKIWTDENRKAWGERVMGKNNGNYGKSMSIELREKIKAANTGRKLSKETKQKLSDVRKGKPKSEEWRRNLSGKRPKMAETMQEKARLGLLKLTTRKVINTETGQIFNSVNEAAIDANKHPSNLSRRIKGGYGYRKINYEYYNESEQQTT